MTRIPTDRPPSPPGDILLHEFIEPMGLTQAEVARAISVPFQRLNGVVRGSRAITTSTALRLARYFGTTPGFWLNLQAAHDLHRAMKEEAAILEQIEPVAL